MPLAVSYRGDIARLLHASNHAMPLSLAASLCGLHAPESIPTPELERPPGPIIDPPPVDDPTPSAQAPEPKSKAQARFWFAESFEHDPTLNDAQTEVPLEIQRSSVLRPGELSYDLEKRLRGRPLLHWSRLWPFLRQVLGRQKPGRQPALRQTIRLLATGAALRRLPRKPQRAWHPQVFVLRDRRESLAPFWDDYEYVLRRLRDVRGKAGLHSINCDSEQTGNNWHQRVLSTPGAALLVLGDLNQYEPDRLDGNWISLGRQLRRRSITPWALCPCPRDRWSPQLAKVWQQIEWDRNARLSTVTSGQRAAVPEMNVRTQQVSALLALLAPAVRVECGLLRDLRFLLGHEEANVGTEYDVFRSVGGDNLGFTLPADQQRELRLTLASMSLDLLENVIRTVQRHHDYTSQVYGHFETLALHSALSEDQWEHLVSMGLVNEQQLKDALTFQIRLVKTLATSQEGIALERIRNFHVRDLDRLIGPDLNLPIMQTALFLANVGRTRPLPIALDYQHYGWAETQLPTPQKQVISIGQEGIGLVAFGFPLATISSRSESVQITSSEGQHWQIAWGDRLPNDAHDAKKLHCSLGPDKLTLSQMPRPSWASRMWYDRYGLAAEFEVGRVPFVLRWIPPGQFTMGSPEDELGRYPNEGPQHKVTISRGYWLGETPVTHAQWRAVVEAGRAEQPWWKKLDRQKLIPAPSQFKAALGSPVENVNWLECRDFCELLTALMKAPDLNFHLPSEAQWEYACRAGTETAFNDGTACTLPEGHDPGLDRLGWFTQNSRGRTHVVKTKGSPNDWGMYDMHGNVWEWCADRWEKTIYRDRVAGVTDPIPDSDSQSTLTVQRVVRGGSWDDHARACRSSCRDGGKPVVAWPFQGVRLAAGCGGLSGGDCRPEAASRVGEVSQTEPSAVRNRAQKADSDNPDERMETPFYKRHPRK